MLSPFRVQKEQQSCILCITRDQARRSSLCIKSLEHQPSDCSLGSRIAANAVAKAPLQLPSTTQLSSSSHLFQIRQARSELPEVTSDHSPAL